jgi:DNA-binding transcriptional LysR family regulator
MELMQLEMFAAVVEEGSVRRASQRVLRTQPAVSIAIRKLEEEFGASLFDRSRRYAFRLTQAGESLYGYAKRILSLRSEATLQLKSISSLRVGRLSIGADESISLHLLPRLAYPFLQRHPGVRLELKCERSESLLTDLKERRIDLAVVSFRPEEEELESSFLAEDELVLIASPTHALAHKTTVKFRDLRREPLLMTDVSQLSPWHQRVADAFLRFKIPFHPQVENAPIEAIKKMVAAGLGVSFVPLLCVRQEVDRGELAVLEIEGFREVRSIWLVRRRALQLDIGYVFLEVASAFGAEMQTNQRTVPPPAKLNKIVLANHRT